MHPLRVIEAGPSNNEQLLHLARETPMRGSIGLRIERAPDFFGLLDLRRGRTVLVAMFGDQPAGCVSLTQDDVFLLGRPTRVGFVGDLKVLPSFRNRGVARRLLQELRQRGEDLGLDIILSLVLGGNSAAMPLMDGRHGLPLFVDAGKFHVLELLATLTASRVGDCEVASAGSSQDEELADFMNRFNRRYEFGPVLSPQDVRAMRDSRSSGVLTARSHGTTRAALSWLDTNEFKQNVVVSLPAAYRTAIWLSRRLRHVLPIVPLPVIGESIRIVYIRRWAYEDGHEGALRQLIQEVRRITFRAGAHFAVLGLHERDPLLRLVRGIPRLKIISHGLIASVSKDMARAGQIAAGVLTEDYALV